MNGTQRLRITPQSEVTQLVFENSIANLTCGSN